MPELHAASAARTEHELSAHEYHHVRIVEPTLNPYQRAAAKTRVPKQV